MSRKTGWILFLILTVQLSMAQQNQVTFEQLNLADGLSHSLISGCAEDHRGFMWFATQDGLNRYDGYKFKVYQQGRDSRNPTNSWINKIYLDREAQMWIVFQGKGVNRFDTKTEIFYNYIPDKDKPGSISDDHLQPLTRYINNTFYEDCFNNLWIGSQSGLNLYNRKKDSFTAFFHNPNDSSSLSHNRITSISGDSQGNIWVGTQKGLNRLDPKTGKFRRFLYDSQGNTLSDTTITTIFVENDSTIWIGTPMGGLNLLQFPDNQGKLKISRFLPKSLIKNAEATILRIYKTRTGRMLIGMIGGFYEIKQTSNGWNTISFENTLYSTIEAIIEDPAGNIWVSKESSKHLLRFNPEITVCEEIPLIAKSFGEIKNIKTLCFQISSTGILWMGTEKDGILKADLNAKNFKLLSNNPLSAPRISHKEVYSIYENTNSELFIGTKEGLNIIDLETKKTDVFEKQSENPKNISFTVSDQIPGNIVGIIKPQLDGKIWLGFFDYKISLFDPKTRKFLSFHHNPSDPNAFKPWSLRSICVTRSNDVYFGSTGGGLVHYNRREQNFNNYPVTETNEGGTSDYAINIIYEDSQGILWIGTALGGLNRFDPKNGAFKHYKHKPKDKKSISNNLIKSILEPKIHGEDILWIGTQRGLEKFDKKAETFQLFDKTDGLPSNILHGILEDNKGNLWISSNKGLTCFDPIAFNFQNFTTEDGLQSDEFNEGAYFKNDKGIMYFGGVNGITWFNPAEMANNPYESKPVITNFSLFNRPVLPLDTIGKRIILTTNISTQKQIVLTHKDKIFSFEFSSLLFISPKKTQFKYILEGFETDVNVVDASKRYASYTNIPTGEYTFKVWATNSDGKWSPDPAILKIEILPPYWEMIWFKSLLVLTILLLFIAILRIRIRMLKKQKNHLKEQVEKRTSDLKKANEELEIHQNEIIKQNEKIASQRDNLKVQNHELEKQKQEIEAMAQKLHQADELKLRFFTNISHEFRTPLTLILGPTENLLEEESYSDTAKVKETLTLIYKNEKRLFRLINQLLEIRRIETGSLKLKVSEEDIVPFLLSITELFEGMAKNNNINFNFISESDSIKFFFDADKIEKTVFNLLSNSFNYTPSGGAIIVFLEHTEIENQSWIKISVTDTGKGIAQKHLPFIFDRFYQLSTKSETGQISSGIGLSLCKDMIEKHKGKISASSEPGKGTTVEVLIPICVECYDKDEFAEDTDGALQLNYSRSMLDIDTLSSGSRPPQSHTATIDSFRALVIEDDPDMRKYLMDELSVEYHVNTAPNGAVGLKMIQTQMPDLIVSDIMMPVMDGYELCKNIKSNELTSHIPVILLTAKTSEEHQIQGLEYGADDYITKPFNLNILKLRIRNILEVRAQLAKKFVSELDMIPSNIKISEIDHGFLEKMVKIIEDNIDDSDLSGDRLASELGVSKGNLYKKLKALSGLTVNIFIRNIRLKIAAKLLKKGNYSISEVAYSVGFNNPKYFSTCFSELFKMSPKEYMQN
jgi:signal transduction histidine kinase/ligand-binding sensor domain-containing protein/CheY-like chemotaxis protein